MKKVFFSVVAVMALSGAAKASDIVEVVQLGKTTNSVFGCSGWYVVKAKDGKIIDTGLWQGNSLSGSSCILGFAAFIADLEKLYPEATIDFGM